MPAKKRAEDDVLQEQKAVVLRMSELCTANKVPPQLLNLPYMGGAYNGTLPNQGRGFNVKTPLIQLY